MFNALAGGSTSCEYRNRNFHGLNKPDTEEQSGHIMVQRLPGCLMCLPGSDACQLG